MLLIGFVDSFFFVLCFDPTPAQIAVLRGITYYIFCHSYLSINVREPAVVY